MDLSKSALNPNAKVFVPNRPLSYDELYQLKYEKETAKRLKAEEENKRLIAEHLAAHPEADPKNPWGWSSEGPYADLH